MRKKRIGCAQQVGRSDGSVKPFRDLRLRGRKMRSHPAADVSQIGPFARGAIGRVCANQNFRIDSRNPKGVASDIGNTICLQKGLTIATDFFYAESTLEGVGFWVEVAESLRHVSSFFVPPRPRPFFLFLLLVSVRQCEALSGNSINVRPSITPAESVAVKQKTFPTQSQAAEKETTNDRFDR